MKQELKKRIGNKFNRTLVKRLGERNARQLWMLLQRDRPAMDSDENNLLWNNSIKSENKGS